jgi:hypothetical protein
MTQGLLNSSFHEPTDGDRRRDLDQFRGQLEDAVFQEVGKIAGRSLQAVSLPLFRRTEGGLVQVVRFRLVGPEAAETGLRVAVEGSEGPATGAFALDDKGTALVADAEVTQVRGTTMPGSVGTSKSVGPSSAGSLPVASRTGGG